jgi:hypothetical protein
MRRAWDVQPLKAEDLEELASAAARVRRPKAARGRKGLPNSYYRGLAAAYLAERERGRGVVPRLAARFDVSPRRIKDHLNIAKRRGFLQGGGHTGRLSYEPGPHFNDKRRNDEPGNRHPQAPLT